MLNRKSLLMLSGIIIALTPAIVTAETCSTLPECSDLGFTYTSDQCGTLKKLKCPFDDDSYFCSGNPCNSVTVYPSTEVCTEYCEEDSNVCVAKRKLTCTELMSKNNCTKYANGSTISGTITGDICLLGTVTQATGYSSSLKFTKATVYDAGLRWPEACESEMTGRAKLDLNYASIESYAYFYTDIETSSTITYAPSNPWSATFGGNSTIRIEYQGNTVWMGTLNLSFYTYDSDYETESTVLFYCSGASDSQWSPTSCDLNISNDYEYAKVNICTYDSAYSFAQTCSSGTCYGEANATCNESEYSSDMCTINDSSVCDNYYY